MRPRNDGRADAGGRPPTPTSIPRPAARPRCHRTDRPREQRQHAAGAAPRFRPLRQLRSWPHRTSTASSRLAAPRWPPATGCGHGTRPSMRLYAAPTPRPSIAWEQPLWPTADSGRKAQRSGNPPAASPPRSSPVSTGAHRSRRRSAQTARWLRMLDRREMRYPLNSRPGPDQERDVWMAAPSRGRP